MHLWDTGLVCWVYSSSRMVQLSYSMKGSVLQH